MRAMNQEEKFLNLFKGGLRIQAHTMSIKTLLSDRNLQRINYSPYYQRNYVWDVVKQTFFIESVILGTDRGTTHSKVFSSVGTDKHGKIYFRYPHRDNTQK